MTVLVSETISTAEKTIDAVFATITRVNENGREGIATLDTEVEGFKYVVIGNHAKGRMALMSQTGGRLRVGSRVEVLKMKKSIDAFRALEIRG